MDTLVFYNCKDSPKTVRKTLKLLEKRTNIHVKQEGDVRNPTITISYTPFFREHPLELNYVYWEDYKRSYFCGPPVINQGGTVTLQLRCDVLMTFQQDILKYNAYVLRSASKPNYDIIDDELVLDQKHIINRRVVNGSPFSRSHLSTQGFTITLTCNGGGSK